MDLVVAGSKAPLTSGSYLAARSFVRAKREEFLLALFSNAIYSGAEISIRVGITYPRFARQHRGLVKYQTSTAVRYFDVPESNASQKPTSPTLKSVLQSARLRSLQSLTNQARPVQSTSLYHRYHRYLLSLRTKTV
ncbi:hypothetical protein DER44DRAFT_743402 [Fusarium oxysporum]|nr:hypothetical protein DER44DRAFT_743402 [Fusarium oxysporum]